MAKKEKKTSRIHWNPQELPKLPANLTTAIEEITFHRQNGTTIKIGGKQIHPMIAFDVFDMKVKLPKVIKDIYSEVLNDPGEWAALAEKFGADLITIHFVSTDPGISDTPISTALKTLDDVLQHTHSPLIIGGSGNKKKDVELFNACAAATEGNRFLLSSADKQTWDQICPIGKKYGHNILLWAQLNINEQRRLVKNALSIDFPRNQIVLDPTCATLGYGLEYSFSIYQRIRLAGLHGDTTLNFPLSGGTTNAWGARESWMKELLHMPNQGGSRAFRGPLWEMTTAVALSLTGLNLAMMLHPLSAILYKHFLRDLKDAPSPPAIDPNLYPHWVSDNY